MRTLFYSFSKHSFFPEPFFHSFSLVFPNRFSIVFPNRFFIVFPTRFFIVFCYVCGQLGGPGRAPEPAKPNPAKPTGSSQTVFL